MGIAWAWWMRLQTRTWRRAVVGLEGIDALEQQGARVLLVVWHGGYQPLLAGVRERPSMLLSTDSFRGRIIEAAARRLGHRCVLRPPELHGEAALDWLCRTLARARRIVIVADGPNGPARRVKRGVVLLAARLGLRIVPCASASSRRLVRRRWDAQEIPLPFARIALVFGEALPALPSKPETSAWRARISRAIDACGREARARLGSAR
jgi:lysophospholipid acyltransferase (LPLAT)-like uncharacterized protein